MKNDNVRFTDYEKLQESHEALVAMVRRIDQHTDSSTYSTEEDFGRKYIYLLRVITREVALNQAELEFKYVDEEDLV